MRVSKKQIRKCLGKNLNISFSEKELCETIQKSKAAFYHNEASDFLSRAEFLYQQGKYIHKRWWGIQGILLIMIWGILKYTESSFYIQRCMGIAAPLFAVLIIPELWKNRKANAMEIECTTYYSLRQVYCARILLFALVDILLLSLFFAATVFSGKILIEEMAIQFFLPFNVTCCICFRTLYSKKLGSEVFALFLCIIWIAVWLQIVLNERVYGTISSPVWVTMIVVSILYLGYCIKKGQKNCKETWEVKPLWN